MGLFKEVKKPVIRTAATSAETRRPAYAKKTAPCIQSCTIGTDVRGWLVPLAQHKAFNRTPAEAFLAAWLKILEYNPFPAICGRVCQHPCELNCNRKAKDGAVAINSLEKFIGDFAISSQWRMRLPFEPRLDAPRVCVVGAGPAGLSAAYHLARGGYAVTVIDAAPLPGGMMRYAIPRSVIPAATLDAEVMNVLGLGIELRLSCSVGQTVSLEELKREFRAIAFAVGLQKAAQLTLGPGINGEAATIGELPASMPDLAPVGTDEVVQRVLNTVSVAIAQGRSMAATIAACLEGRPDVEKMAAPVIRSDRIKLDWYPVAQRLPAGAAISEADVIAEAARCLSCGMCMDCETCWMYCSANCFVRLPKGEHYKIKLDTCTGCGKCAEACPCGYIEMN